MSRPKAAAWDNEPHSAAKQRALAHGRTVFHRDQAVRRGAKRADYLHYPAHEAREILNDGLGKHTTDAEHQSTLHDVLKGPPISHRINVNEIIANFGAADNLRSAVNQLHELLHAA